jgi:DNA polymerase zeta
VVAPSRGKFVPDPNADPLAAICFSFQDSDVEPNSSDLRKGVIVVRNALWNFQSLRDVPGQVVASELDLLNTVVDVVLDLDPDVVCGWEVQSSSWGYLGARGQKYGLCCETTAYDDNADNSCRTRYRRTHLPRPWTTVFE